MPRRPYRVDSTHERQQTELTELKAQLAAQREQQAADLNAKNDSLRMQMEQQAADLASLKKHQATELAQLKEQLELVKALLTRSGGGSQVAAFKVEK